MKKKILLKSWLKNIANYRSEKEIINHICRHATEHIKNEGVNQDWVNSMLNLCFIYNLQNKKTYFKEEELINLLERFKKKHNSEV
jgi:hypothetical protein